MTQFNEYPKWLHHPNHRPAEWETVPGVMPGEKLPKMTAAEMFPDVMVKRAEEEMYYASRGYRPKNNPDPQAYELAMMESTYTPGYEHQQYPKWKYSKTEIPLIVKSKAEEDALEGEWFDSPAFATEEDINPNPASLPADLTEETAVPKVDKRSKAYKEAQKAQA